ncbi:MAG: hypothetical protein SCJ97_07670 [Bacillota bacterium]|nr:hypothetical protein [Bacillota bacterium]
MIIIKDDKILEQLVIKLLEPGISKTTTQVVEEFRIEYPAQWRELEKEGEMLFGVSCTSLQQPSTRISRILLSLPEEKCLCRRKNNQYYWSKPF